MPVYQLIVGAHSQQPYMKIIYASHRLYLVNNYEGCYTQKYTSAGKYGWVR